MQSNKIPYTYLYGLIISSLLLILFSPARGFGQTTYSWQGTNGSWLDAANWTRFAGAGVGYPETADIAEFTGYHPDAVDPVLNNETTITQLRLHRGPQAEWYLSGSSTLTTGTASVSGIVTDGAGTYTIDLGTGSAASLILSGPNDGRGGALQVGSSTLILSGNTIATAGSSNITIRSGTLVLDNTAGNPNGQRLSTTGSVSLNGGGSTLEFRGSAAGTTFSGLTGALAAAGGGNTYLRTVQQGDAPLTVNFQNLSRASTTGVLLVENIGTGFVGDSGKPTIAFTLTGPTVRQNVISSATGAIASPWVAVTQRTTMNDPAVTGRWACYSGGIMASTTSPYTGDFSVATAGSNILFNPTSAATVTLSTPSTQLASVVLEPAVPGATLEVGSGLNTYGLMHSGVNRITVTGTNLFTPISLARALLVLSPTAELNTTASLNMASSTSTTTIGGSGFVSLTGSSNQITSGSFTGTASLSLAGGVLRGNSSNLIFTSGGTGGARLSFRGGVLEYDVSQTNALFNLALGTGVNQVNWTQSVINNLGGGGFSAYSTNPNRNLTVTIPVANDVLYWNDSAASGAQTFISDGYALKFGSLRSNATVLWTNPIALDGNSDGSMTNTLSQVVRTREFHVTRGEGSLADQTQLLGIVSGSATSDLLKTGTGVLVLAASNTYQGRTDIAEGELRVAGQAASASGTGMGEVIVRAGATLGGNGQALGPVTVQSGGSIRGGDGTAVNQTLLTGPLTVGGSVRMLVVVGAGNGNNDTSLSGASLIAMSTGSTFGRISLGDTIRIVLTDDGTLDRNGATSYTRRIVAFSGSPLNLPEGLYTSSSSVFVLDATNFSFAPNWSVLVASGTIDVSFTPITISVSPEPSEMLLLSALMLGLQAWCRRKE